MYINFTKIWLIMRLTTVLLITMLMQVSALGLAQRITLKESNVPLENVLKEIREQSGYDIFFNGQLLNKTKNITVNVTNVKLEEALNASLKGLPLTYKLEGKTVTIIAKDEPSFLDKALIAIQRKIRDLIGRVVDGEGNPLPNASIRVKGKSAVTNTDQNGEFEIKDVDEDAVLLVSYVGFKTLEIPVKDAVMPLEIKLNVATGELEEVKVTYSTGYQDIPKERATGSFSTISKELLNRPAMNIGSNIVGTAAGVVATLDVDGNPTFQIRGLSSLTTNALPLIVVDGFAIEGGFSAINPNDVESVTILKDAAAASIWGARAANGVIVVTTKKARGGLKIDFSSFARVGAKLDLDYVNPLASSAETIAFEKLAFGKWGGRYNINDNFRSYYNYGISQGMLALNEEYLGRGSAEATLERLVTQDNRQQIRDYLLATPLNQQYNLSISSSTERSQNILSLMYADNQSNFKNTSNHQYMVNFRNTSSLFKWLDFNFSGMLQYNDNNNSGSTLGDLRELSPYDMLVKNDGSLESVIKGYYGPLMEANVPFDKFPYPNWLFYNPISEMNNRKLTSKDLNARIQAGLTFKIIKGLTFDSKIQYELFNTFNRSLYNEETFYVRDMVNKAASWNLGTTVTPNLPAGSILNQSRAQINGYNFRNQLNYNRDFGKHEINLAGGTEITNRLSQTFSNPTTYGYNDESLTVGTFPNGSGGTFKPIQDWIGFNQQFNYTNSFTYQAHRFVSLYGNMAYTFNKKYTLQGSARADASNFITDDPKYRWAPFWSLGLGWQISKENFMQSLTWVDRLALRLTYGFNGNVATNTGAMPLLTLNPTPDPDTKEYKATIASYGNPTLRWERTGTYNLGIDYSLFGGKLFGKVDVYKKDGKDLFATVTIPTINGSNSQKLNNAGMINRGIEAEVGTMLDILGSDIRWRGSVNFSYNYNEITKLYKNSYAIYDLYNGGTYAYVEGYNAATQWRYKYAGISNIGDDSTPNWQPVVQGHDGKLYAIGANMPGDPFNYMWDTGTTIPPYVMGFYNQFKIYNFDLSFVITGKFGHKFKHNTFNYPTQSLLKMLPNARLTEVMGGDPMKIIPLPQNDNEPNYSNWGLTSQFVDYTMDKADNIRLQEVNLTYNVPSKLLSGTKLNNLQVYAQANNLFVITNNKYNEDPEFPLGQVRPQPKFTFGFKLDF